MSSYVCLTHREWANLCSTGRVRIHTVRLVDDPRAAKGEGQFDLFALAPDRYAIGESADLLIAEVTQLRDSHEGETPGASGLGMRWLLLEDVAAFFPVREDDAWKFEADAQRAQVTLSAPLFERLWASWTNCELERAAFVNGMALMRALGLRDEAGRDMDGDALRSFASLVLDPQRGVTERDGVTARLFRDQAALFDLVRDDTDTSAIFVSCPVEWATLCTGANLLDTGLELAARAHSLHERHSASPFSATSLFETDLASFLSDLVAWAPEAFRDGWTPTSITMYVRTRHRLQYGKPSPEEVVAVIRAVELADGRKPAALLAFLLGMVLDSSRTHALALQLQPASFPVTTLLTSSTVEQVLGDSTA